MSKLGWLHPCRCTLAKNMIVVSLLTGALALSTLLLAGLIFGQRRQSLAFATILALLSLAAGWVSETMLKRKVWEPLSELTRIMATVTRDRNYGIRVAPVG